jgi:hypothetical protein
MTNQDYRFCTEFAYEAKVILDPVQVATEKTPHGGRNVVRIKGGTFKGPDIEGEVLEGGADWQLIRPDGVRELEARYMMRTNDGVSIHVLNRVLSRPDPASGDPFSPGFYRRCVLSFEAPMDSRYAWFNTHVFLGTLTPATTEKESAVIIRVWKLL